MPRRLAAILRETAFLTLRAIEIACGVTVLLLSKTIRLLLWLGGMAQRGTATLRVYRGHAISRAAGSPAGGNVIYRRSAGQWRRR